MRTVSFLASATEILAHLGLVEHLVGISHECDHPPQVLGLPRVSRPRFDPNGLTSGEIDAAVRESMRTAGSVYQVDEALLARLRPRLVLTQAVCEVCAVPTPSVRHAVAALPGPPRVVSLDAHTLDEILASIRQVAAALGEAARGTAAEAGLRQRLENVSRRVAEEPAPRVLALEWLDPWFTPGHWVPEMVAHAGGRNLRGVAGEPSREAGDRELRELDPDVLLLVPCGYAMAAAREDADAAARRLRALAPRAIASGNCWVGDSAFFSRSGPRVVEGIEALASALHPSSEAPRPAPEVLQRWPGEGS
jgi:iron complex transport system substrate-binding protein